MANKRIYTQSEVVEMAKRIDPTINLREYRPGVTRKNMEFSIEQWCRIVIAARAGGISPSKFVRIVTQNHIDEHTIMPEFMPPPFLGVSKHAFEVGASPSKGGDILRADQTRGVDPAVVERLRE